MQSLVPSKVIDEMEIMLVFTVWELLVIFCRMVYIVKVEGRGVNENEGDSSLKILICSVALAIKQVEDLCCHVHDIHRQYKYL